MITTAGRLCRSTETGMRCVARAIRKSGIRSVVVASIFSPLDPGCEERARAILCEECPDANVTMSHHLGRIGLLERENAARLNAALIDLARKTVASFVEAISVSGIAAAPLFLTQNDGTVVQAEMATALPVMSFASGTTNSIRGAAFLSGLSDAMVIDIGGTTIDVGQLRQGFPREANSVVEVGGARTRMQKRPGARPGRSRDRSVSEFRLWVSPGGCRATASAS
jgi:N-methylhydantoinase A/oxoprolinase/acetone carboxylase beta subunit